MISAKVAIITLNWKDADSTIGCIESLLKQDYPDFQIFVVENGSPDESGKKIEEWGRSKLHENFFPLGAAGIEATRLNHKVVFIRSDENLGFAGGNNLALRIALKKGFQYMWLINNDTVQDKSSLSALVQAAESDRKAGLVTSKVLFFSRPDTVESLGSKLFVPLGIFRHIGGGKNSSEVSSTPFEVPLVYGCSFLVRKELIEDAGLMDDRYFLLREESDWSIRARRRGWKIYSAPDSVVWHKVSRSVGKRSELFFYYVTRNTLLFMGKHYPLFLPLTALVMFPLASGLVAVDSIFSDRKNPLARVGMVILGYLHFLKGRFGKFI